MSHKADNAFRVLQGEKPVQSFRCRIGFHRWSNWEVADDAYVLGPARQIARCVCVDCNLPREERPYSKTLGRGQ